MSRLLKIENHINQLRDYTPDQVRREIDSVEKTLKNGEKWLTENDETHSLFEACLFKFRDTLRRRAALYLKECEPEILDLF